MGYKGIKYKRSDITTFLRESNLIEGVTSILALDHARKAFNYLRRQDKITKEGILHCHKILMRKLDKKIAGKLRSEVTREDGELGVNVRVGNNVKIHFNKVESALDKWLFTANNKLDKKKLKQQHIAFEHIHPFVDGNGRIGRIIFLCQTIKNEEMLYTFKKEDVAYYYSWFETEEDKKKQMKTFIETYLKLEEI